MTGASLGRTDSGLEADRMRAGLMRATLKAILTALILARLLSCCQNTEGVEGLEVKGLINQSRTLHVCDRVDHLPYDFIDPLNYGPHWRSVQEVEVGGNIKLLTINYDIWLTWNHLKSSLGALTLSLPVERVYAPRLLQVLCECH